MTVEYALSKPHPPRAIAAGDFLPTVPYPLSWSIAPISRSVREACMRWPLTDGLIVQVDSRMQVAFGAKRDVFSDLFLELGYDRLAALQNKSELDARRARRNRTFARKNEE